MTLAIVRTSNRRLGVIICKIAGDERLADECVRRSGMSLRKRDPADPIILGMRDLI